MKFSMQRLAACAIACVALTCVAGAARAADDYPNHPVRWLVGYPPGGSTDIVARLIGQYLSEHLGQQFVIENKPGAGNNLATEMATRADPDGYTVLLVNPANAINATLYKNLTFNFIRDMAPVAGIIRVPNVMEVNPNVPAKTVAEFISYAKANPGKVNMASAGVGTSTHLSGALFMMMTGTELVHVPYRGAAPALQDLLGGQIDLSCLEASATLPSVAAGKIKAYAVMSEDRWPKSPNTPTMIESGVPGLSIVFWHGLWTTKGTPKDVVDRLVSGVTTALADPAVKQRIEGLGMVIFPRDQQSPAALLAYHRAELAKWWPVIKDTGIRAEE